MSAELRIARPWTSSLATALGLVGLVGGLAAIDVRVRDGLLALVDGRTPSGEIASAFLQIKSFAMVAAQMARDQSIAHAPLTIFAVAAALLLVFMLRT